MFTKYWYQAIIAHVTNTSRYFRSINDTSVEWNSSQLQKITRIGYDINDYGTPSIYRPRTSLTTYGGVIFGDGATPPTLNDYKLSGNLITSINTTASVLKFKDDYTGTHTIEAEYTVNNTGTQSITIREIGLIAAGGASSSQIDMKCLLERTVLDSPVIIPRGGSAVITYTIRIFDPSVSPRFDLP